MVFTLKQWFVHRGNVGEYDYSNVLSWCNSIGYRMPLVRDLTNSNHQNVGALPASSGNWYQRRIGAGFFTEWGYMPEYSAGDFITWYFTSEFNTWYRYIVSSTYGVLDGSHNIKMGTLCASEP